MEKKSLIVASLAKKLIAGNDKLRTSKEALQRLSDCVEVVLTKAANEARKDGRKTVLPRDILALDSDIAAESKH